ncbi:hypothetical protein BJ322DRAFT_1078792 [Thelephora terrestris]|uniref:F-box domain-containing protein n=1 Tax=Thelephora terrestris TaxID=56493 RepID=A0A9P6H9E5_9AGAM|nr:hypothetical protein BJ322DRAFT_1078792 [Thelephora terrestris]
MDSETLEAKQSTSVEIRPAETSGIPHDIVDEILDHLNPDSDFKLSLLNCSLISKSWVVPCRQRLFHNIALNGGDMAGWLKSFPEPERSPAHFVRELTLSLGGRHSAPEEFFRHTPWFKNVKKLTVLGNQGLQPVWIPPFGRLPQSVTSLTINTDIATLLEIRDLMAQLPNLNDFALSGSIHGMDGDGLLGIGTVLKGEFGGQLRLLRLKRHADPEVMNMLLEVPTGLHFTEVYILTVYDCLPSTVRLAEACGKNLVKFTYSIDEHGDKDVFDRSFDFTKLPNLQEVKFNVNWTAGGLLWISVALSTINPATSPHLYTLQLKLGGRFLRYIPEDRRERLTDDLRLIDEEVARIEHEFMGALELTVAQYPGFRHDAG